MVDIDSHVAWGLDDGAGALEQSLAMLRIAAESGTSDIVATPHANLHYRFEPDLVRQRIEEISSAAGGRPRVHYGCDFHLSFDNVQDALEKPEKYTINGGRYLLVEFPNNSLAGMGPVMAALLDRGLVPIMTHPERHPVLGLIGDQFQEWIRMGCLVQVTAQSLLGCFGAHAEKSAWEMVRRGLAHFVASDAHDEHARTPRLDEAFAAIARRVHQARAEALLVNHPTAVILGQSISVDVPEVRRDSESGGEPPRVR